MAKSSSGGSLQFTFGLINSANKYLTAETFGFKIAASGNSLKKKQTWSLEQKSDGSEVYFKSCLGRYLGADKNGKISCDAEEPGDENAFQVESTTDGLWAIKSSKYGRYFGGSGDNLSCFQQTIEPTYLWSVHLAMHPQVNIFNERQQRFAHINDDGDELQMSKPTPWGVNFLLTLVFQDKGYAIVTSNNRFLSCDGSLEASCSEKTLYTIEFYSGKLAFKSKFNSKYLAPVGPKGRIETRKNTPGKDEYFTLIDSHPQISLLSKTKNRYVSGKQGLQLSANQDEVETKETFQLEIDANSEKVYLRNDQDKYWRVTGSSIQADATSKSDNDAAFDLEWLGKIIRLRSSNGKYVSVKASGHLVAAGNEPEDFVMGLTNRPLIVFRGEYGFVGAKGNKLEGNRASYDIFEMKQNEGAYTIKAPNGKYISVNDEMKLAADADEGTLFALQLCKNSRLVLKPVIEGAGYVTSDHVGYITANGKDISKSTLWEY